VRLALLWVAAAAISGFTLRRYLGPLDEGILMQAATRMADGQWPWQDFAWSYGPGEPLVVMLLGKAFGSSLLWWRLLRVAADATAAVLVYALVRDRRPRWALAAWAAAALTAAQPTSANPTAPALAFSLGAVLAATRGRPVVAGVLAAAAAFWRPDVGAIAALAAAATLLVAGRRDAIRCLGVAAVGLLLLYGPFLVAAGPSTVWNALVVQSTRDGEWWRLPLGFQGGDAKDFVTWLLPFATIVTLAFAARRATLGLFVLGVGAVIYFLSRADLEHAQGLLVIAAAAAALIRPKLVGATMLALLIAVGAANRASALLRPPTLAAFESVRVPPQEAATLPKVISEIRRLVPPGDPIYVAPRRSDLVTFSDPLLYYLADRPNALHRDFLLQAKPDEQRKIVAALQRAKPKVIVRWLAPASAQPEPNRRGRPSGSTALDDYLKAAYREQNRFGDYAILVPCASC
jgi:hypothetical protein